METHITKLPFTLNVAGFCGSGKSYFIQYLIKSFENYFDCILIFSNTANFTEDYKFLEQMDKKHFIFNSVVLDDKIKAIMKIQKDNRSKNVKKNILVVFDDIMGSIKDSKPFKDLISTHRHYNISIIFSIQYITAAATYLREICSYIVIFNQRTQAALKTCYENYFADSFGSFTEFKTHFVNKLQNFNFYFIDRINNKKSIMKCPSTI